MSPQVSGRDVIISGHARIRMRERKITEAEVYSVLKSRGLTYPAQRGRTHVLDGVGGRRIRVTVAETDTTCTVVTVVAVDEDQEGK